LTIYLWATVSHYDATSNPSHTAWAPFSTIRDETRGLTITIEECTYAMLQMSFRITYPSKTCVFFLFTHFKERHTDSAIVEFVHLM